MQLNRSIAFTSSWVYTLYTAMCVSLVLSAILVFLQPFDTYQQELPYKNLKLWGYGLCILVPVLLLHIPEKIWYTKQQHKWYLLNEILSLTVGFIDWCLSFGIPFIPFLMPVWLFLRHRFSRIEIQTRPPQKALIRIEGQNQDEVVTFTAQDFIMAHVQSNYVALYVLENGVLTKHLLRSTLSALVDQIPSALQVHRSYLINILYVGQIQGNTRKGSVTLTHITEPVPVSPKHFAALKKELQFRP